MHRLKWLRTEQGSWWSIYPRSIGIASHFILRRFFSYSSGTFEVSKCFNETKLTHCKELTRNLNSNPFLTGNIIWAWCSCHWCKYFDVSWKHQKYCSNYWKMEKPLKVKNIWKLLVMSLYYITQQWSFNRTQQKTDEVWQTHWDKPPWWLRWTHENYNKSVKFVSLLKE